MVKVAVVHPDLGIGGAERLIVDASKALQDVNHEVVVYTNYHDRSRCFHETTDGTLRIITVVSWLPRSIFDRFHAMMAYFKMICIAFYLILFEEFDLVLCDQVSACIPILKYLNFRNKNCKIVFYCHFPDQLLTHRNTLAKALYRKPIDSLEEYSTGLADVILVNSKFTNQVVKRTFRSLRDRELTVLYPCVDVEQFSKFVLNRERCTNISVRVLYEDSETFKFLSLNRFERKKNLSLAIRALSEFITRENNETQSQQVELLIAGGYDERLTDCVDYFLELKRLAAKLKVEDRVIFIRSPSDYDKLALLKLCDAVLYTPENEHFGIVPLEAMAMSKPVIASKSGGPLETIEDGVTGFLSDPDSSAFADAMSKLYSNRKSCDRMGLAGFKRVAKHFSYEAFGRRLNQICSQFER